MKIGFTGHQKIAHPERWGWVKDQLQQVLREVAKPGDLVASSLAKGGDQILSQLAIDEGLSIEVIIPCAGYEGAFTDTEGLAQYRKLLSKSADVIALDFPSPSENAFLAAGKKIVDRADLVITLWDGKNAVGKGGTGDIVEYARELGRQVIHVNPDSMQVQHLDPVQEK